MAIISCPNCGKQITDRMEKCPHCSATLLMPKASKAPIAGELKVVSKNNMICVLIATVLAILSSLIMFNLASNLARPMGDYAIMGVLYSKDVFFSSTIVIVIIEAVWLCLCPVLLKQKIGNQFIVLVVSTIFFGILGIIVQYHAVLHLHRGMQVELIAYSRMHSLGFGVAAPIILGSLSLPSSNFAFIKKVALQVGLGVAFLVCFFILGALMVNVFAMGLRGISFASLISAILVVAFAIVTNKNFLGLIAPKISE